MRQTSYQIIFCMGVNDLIQLICHVYSGAVAVTGNNFQPWLEKALGGAANSAWISMIALTLVLALNRWNVIVFDGSLKKTFFVSHNIPYYDVSCP